MLGIPAPTPYDLRFSLFGVPVRIHPFFWVMASVVLGWGSVGEVLPCVAAVLVSIMVHEFGHALANRAFGVRPGVVLYAFGGLCYDQDGRYLSPWQRFLVVAAGPAAGFALFGLTFLADKYFGPSLIGLSRNAQEFAHIFIWGMLFINLFWSILNLLPVFPLDGGQLAAILLQWRSPSNGLQHAFMISIVAAFGVAAVLAKWGNIFGAMLFAFMGIQNIQNLQASRYQSPY